MCSLAAKSVLGAVTKGQGLIQCAVLDRRQSSNLSLWVAGPAEPRLETPSTNLSVSQFSHSVVSNSLQSHGLQHTRSPCPSPTPRVYSNSCALNRWYYPVISSSVVPFSSHLRSFPASGFFPVSQFFTSGGQSIGVSASASVLPMNIQVWFPLGLTSRLDLLAVQGSLKNLLQHHSSKASVLQCSAFFMVQVSHDYWKNHSFD